MRLGLVFNPFRYKVHEENIRIVQKYFGLFPPLSLAWVAAIAEQAGHDVVLIDARTMDLSKEEVLKSLEDFRPDMLGFMMTTYMFQDTMEWIKYLKGHLNVPVLIGGYNLRVYPRESVSLPEIDFGVVEHAYYTVPRLFEEIESGRRDFDRVPGLVFKRDGKIIVTPHPQKIDFDKFPNPARHLLANELYAEFPTERKNFTVMVTSLGCPYDCGFCEAGRTPFSPRTPETVVAEIEECYERHGIREIDIFDYEFTANAKRVFEICRLLQERNMDLTWACRSRIDTVSEPLLEEMKKAGCRRIYFGIESGVQDILDRVNKRITIQQVEETIAKCRELGIRSLGFFLIGAPGETRESVKKTVAFAKSLDLDYVQFSKCLAKPLTPLWQDMVEREGKDYWQDFILGRETDRVLPRHWTDLTNREIDRLTRWAYISYYVRPRLIWKHVKSLKSFSEFKRKMCAFLDMMFSQESVSRKDEQFKAFNENTRKRLQKDKKTILKRDHPEG